MRGNVVAERRFVGDEKWDTFFRFIFFGCRHRDDFIDDRDIDKAPSYAGALQRRSGSPGRVVNLRCPLTFWPQGKIGVKIGLSRLRRSRA